MSREWKPGDVARREGTAIIGVAVPRCPNESHERGLHWHYSNGGWNSLTSAFRDHRPLVVIDPENPDDVGRLATTLAPFVSGILSSHNLAAALREFADPTPPKPEEPTKWLAAAEDAHGDRWVRDGLCRDGASEGDWWSVDRAANGSPEPWRADWSVIDVIRILSPGYDPEAES